MKRLSLLKNIESIKTFDVEKALLEELTHYESNVYFPITQARVTPKTAAEKACYLVQSSNIQFALSESGAGQEIATLLQQQDIKHRAVYLSVSAYSRNASDSRYWPEDIDTSLLKSYISPTRLKQQLDVEYRMIPTYPKLRRAAIANTMRTSHYNGHGWIGYKGQLWLNQPPIEVIMHVRLFHSGIPEQKIDAGKLGINLAYAINNAAIRNSSEQFYKGLIGGIQADLVEVDNISFQGQSLAHLQEESSQKLLKYGLTNIILVSDDNRAISGQSFNDDIISGMQNKIELTKESGSFPLTECGISHKIQKWDPFTASAYDITQTDEALHYLQKLKDNQEARRNLEVITEIINSATDPIDRKIKEMNTRGFVQGLVSEIDSSDFIHMLFSRPFSPIYESVSMRASDLARNYHLPLPHIINKQLIQKILKRDYDRIQLTPPSPGNCQLLRKFSIFKHVQSTPLRDKTINTDGWIAVRAQQDPAGEAKNVILHLKTSDTAAPQSNSLASKITVNLWHGFFNISHNPTDFRNGLLEGIDAKRHDLNLEILENELSL